MELATLLFHDPRGLNEMMDNVPYSPPGTHHPELSNGSGGITPRRPELDWTDQDYVAPHQPLFHDDPSHPPRAAVSASTLTHREPYESNSGVPSGFHRPTDSSACNLGNPNYTEKISTPHWTAVWDSLPGGYCGNPDLVASWRADNMFNPYDFSPTSLSHPVPQIYGSAYDFMQFGANNPSGPWTAMARTQRTSEAMEPEPQPRPTEELSVRPFQETDQDSDLSSFRTLPLCAVGPQPPTTPPSTIQTGLDDAADIHKHMRRGVGGGATCAWEHGSGECGYSSHIDLVKRHIKRVHYRLK